MRKLLGQHFLKNRGAVKKIAEALDSRPGDLVVEIGAGHGELTNEVLSLGFEVLDKNKSRAIKILAIEKDRELAKQLKEKFAGENSVEVVEGDALKILSRFPETHNPKPKARKLVGNVPYYITGKLLRVLSELENKPDVCVFTLQKEVAERICSGPPRMNRLAAITRFWAKPEILFYIPRTDFSPPPEVDSAVIRLITRTGADRTRTDADKYYGAVRALFAQPRKTILNNLISGRRNPEGVAATKNRLGRELQKIGVNPQDRPQNLGVEEIEKIADTILLDNKFSIS